MCICAHADLRVFFLFTVAALVDTVHAKSQNDGQAEGGNQFKYRARRAKQEKPERASLVPSHMLVTDVSHVKQATRIFKGLVFCILFHSCFAGPLAHIEDMSIYSRGLKLSNMIDLGSRVRIVCGCNFNPHRIQICTECSNLNLQFVVKRIS